ncbi:E3 ubiquitin-protein ligase HOS1 isoform X2 [Brachypodium distachyon]|uniref:E3 ubiquitin-protein ligase HOS1 isoform X2 n=1 Tax=Brachypodium distachyon TaxID=15368 RepID=UPI00052FF3EE|nr:E3 ubiquitin-protein ligase HOS1 isoform X2 [Brachypodium distachyon]|eukprot:XP_010230313.1 E3 ubiquitin-protein ligase HOS1 isoform X2 [Brachypodium distachyon]
MYGGDKVSAIVYAGEDAPKSVFPSQDALEQLASIDLIELSKEARIEHCRATRDLSSCGRYVQHVLNSCGHASLCAECSQRCDVCPICRSPIPDNGNRVRLRLYHKCLEAGLISKHHDERFQDKEGHGDPVNMDVKRLHSLFDVALQNNLVSLICHYITDVCLDENAVSSDPLLAFLLDEVVIKDWCKRAFNALISEIGMIYRSGLEMMKSKLPRLQKFVVQLAGISSVVEAMIASFREAAHVGDLHQLIEKTTKAKQHLEAMIWCTRHEFLEQICSRHANFATWSSDVIVRKTSAEERQWPEFSGKMSGYDKTNQGILFIEQALQNLGVQQCYIDNEEEVEMACLQNEQSSSMFCPTIDQFGVSSYPFKNLREAVDVLFLHGASDMVIAKQAIFLYYIFDRHWTRPDSEWRYLVDDFAATFGISSRTLLECLVFCLLDDHSSQALEEACSLLPKISSKETHPKIAQVLLERHKPDMALVILRCTGCDSYSTTATVEKDGMSLLSEAVTAIRVRIEYGHVTEAFMFHRSYCSRLKEQRPADMTHVEDALRSSWDYHVEVMMTEFCNICIERKIVDKMIDLPWDSEEEKYLHKSLFDTACDMPAEPCGSLLVVFYLQRFRYLEAYDVHRSLQSFEENTLETASEEVASKISTIAKWRESLVAKCLEMLPEVQREDVRNISSGDRSQFAIRTMQTSSPVNPLVKSPNPAIGLSLTFAPALQDKSNPLHSRNIYASNCSGAFISSVRSEFGKKVPSILESRPVPQGTPTSNMRSTAGGIFPSLGQNGESPYLKGTKEFSFMNGESGFKKGTKPAGHDSLPMYFNLGSGDTPMKKHQTSLLKTDGNKTTFFQGKDSVRKGEFGFGLRAEKPFILSGTGIGQNSHSKVSESAGFRDNHLQKTEVSMTQNTLSLGKKPSVGEGAAAKGGSRWRSDESSEDEDEKRTGGYMESGASLVTRRRPRLSRR